MILWSSLTARAQALAGSDFAVAGWLGAAGTHERDPAFLDMGKIMHTIALEDARLDILLSEQRVRDQAVRVAWLEQQGQTEQAAAARRMLAIKQQELALMEDHLRLQLELHRRRQHQA
jgi:hypothetical protein